MNPLLVQYRRDLHQIPEIDLEVPQTCGYIRRVLEQYPCRVFSPAPNSLCAYFDFGRESTVAFRADMDALPVQENTGFSFASRIPGRMHACGHDGHMAMVLALAEEVARSGGKGLPRNVLLVFQPGEEGTGGAEPICQSGVFREVRADRIFGFHLWPDLPRGVVASRPLELMARNSEVTVEITGRSSHIAKSEQGADALLAAAEMVLRGYRMEREEVAPEEYRLLKFGKMESGSARNVISGSSLLLGSLRSFKPQVFDFMKGRLEEMGKELERETGCTLNIDFSQGYPPVINHPGLFQEVHAFLGEGLKVLEKPVMIAEDFSFYQQEIPGVFLFLGTGEDIPLHSDRFRFDEEILEIGLGVYKKLLRMP
jgi:amidohydrolase